MNDGENPEVSMHDAYRAADLILAARQFVRDPKVWTEKIGMPCQLERYEVSAEEAGEAIKAAVQLANEVSVPTAPSGSDGCTEEEAKTLITFLERFGPLGPVVEVVEPIPPPRREESPAAVSLTDLRDQIHAIASARQALRRFDGETRREVAVVAEPYLSEVHTRPFVSEGRIRYVVVPATLRAAIWIELLRVGQLGLEPKCKICARSLPRRPGRGRQAEYCEDHNSARDRALFNAGAVTLEVEGGTPWSDQS